MNKQTINAQIYTMAYWALLCRLEIIEGDDLYDVTGYTFKFKLSRVTNIFGRKLYPGEYVFYISKKFVCYLNKVNKYEHLRI